MELGSVPFAFHYHRLLFAITLSRTRALNGSRDPQQTIGRRFIAEMLRIVATLQGVKKLLLKLVRKSAIDCIQDRVQSTLKPNVSGPEPGRPECL
jgi:hypothetical protein